MTILIWRNNWKKRNLKTAIVQLSRRKQFQLSLAIKRTTSALWLRAQKKLLVRIITKLWPAFKVFNSPRWSRSITRRIVWNRQTTRLMSLGGPKPPLFSKLMAANSKTALTRLILNRSDRSWKAACKTNSKRLVSNCLRRGSQAPLTRHSRTLFSRVTRYWLTSSKTITNPALRCSSRSRMTQKATMERGRHVSFPWWRWTRWRRSKSVH